MKRDAILNEIKTYMSKINLQSGILTVENRRSREKKRICSEVSVNSPGNPCSQSRRRNGVLDFRFFTDVLGWLGSRVASMSDSDAVQKGPGSKSQS